MRANRFEASQSKAGFRGATRATQNPPSGARVILSGYPGRFSANISEVPARCPVSHSRRTRFRYVSLMRIKLSSLARATPFAKASSSRAILTSPFFGVYAIRRPLGFCEKTSF